MNKFPMKSPASDKDFFFFKFHECLCVFSGGVTSKHKDRIERPNPNIKLSHAKEKLVNSKTSI